MRENDNELVRGYHRWRAMEEQGRDDEADAAFGPVLRDAAGERPVSLEFTARTMATVAAAAERDARRARRTRKVLVPIGVAAAASLLYVSGGVIVSAMATSVMWTVNLLVLSIVGVATNAEAGADLWSVMRSLGRAAAAFMSSPAVTVSIIAIQGIAMAALIALQRLLGADREFYR
jgi:hypothetical protein